MEEEPPDLEALRNYFKNTNITFKEEPPNPNQAYNSLRERGAHTCLRGDISNTTYWFDEEGRQIGISTVRRKLISQPGGPTIMSLLPYDNEIFIQLRENQEILKRDTKPSFQPLPAHPKQPQEEPPEEQIKESELVSVL